MHTITGLNPTDRVTFGLLTPNKAVLAEEIQIYQSHIRLEYKGVFSLNEEEERNARFFHLQLFATLLKR